MHPFGHAQTMMSQGAPYFHVSDTFPPLCITTGRNATPKAFTNVRIVLVSPYSLLVILFVFSPVMPRTSISLGTSWTPLSLQFHMYIGDSIFSSFSSAS